MRWWRRRCISESFILRSGSSIDTLSMYIFANNIYAIIGFTPPRRHTIQDRPACERASETVILAFIYLVCLFQAPLQEPVIALPLHLRCFTLSWTSSRKFARRRILIDCNDLRTGVKQPGSGYRSSRLEMGPSTTLGAGSPGFFDFHSLRVFFPATS